MSAQAAPYSSQSVLKHTTGAAVVAAAGCLVLTYQENFAQDKQQILATSAPATSDFFKGVGGELQFSW